MQLQELILQSTTELDYKEVLNQWYTLAQQS